MSKKNLVGVAVFFALFLAGFAFTAEGLSGYWNFAALLVVVSGLGVSILAAYPVAEVRRAFAVLRGVYAEKVEEAGDLVNGLLEVCLRCRRDGTLSLERVEKETADPFLRGGLQLLVDNCKGDEVRDVLESEMQHFSLRRQETERIFQAMARFAPAFGLAGSVIGIIGMLTGIHDTDVILASIPMAFISTLYGVVAGNLVFAPMAEAVNHATRRELHRRRLILEGISLVADEQNPYRLERRLAAFLTPEERALRGQALRALVRRFAAQRRKEQEVKELQAVPVAQSPEYLASAM